MRKLLVAALGFLAGATPAFAADAPEQCQLVRAASIDMNLDLDGSPIVPITIGGQQLNLEIDTGGVYSMLSEDAAQRLGLHLLSTFDVRWKMFGGTQISHYTIARDVVLGGLKASSLPVLVVPSEFNLGNVDGTLAPDILAAYDDEFDFANGKFNLFLKNKCDGSIVYWTREPYAEIPFAIEPDSGHIVLTVILDGKEVRATVDTGASHSVMSLEAAKRLFGIADNDPRLKPSPGHGGKDVRFPFASLAFKGEVNVQNPDITLVPDSVSKMFGTPPLLLGVSILRQLHVYIAYRDHKFYVTPASAR
jgi:predicted aspartyl protease